MPLPFSLFLALKYLRPKRSFLSVISLLSILGVLLGVATLVIVLSVMSGFDRMWRENILAFNAHLTVFSEAAPHPLEEAAWIEAIEEVEGVTGAAPFLQGLVFITHEDRVLTPFLRGVSPTRERRVSRVPDHMVRGAFDLDDRGIVLGAALADRLGVGVGDEVLAYSPQSFLATESLRLPDEFVVRGIFELGMFDLDMGYVLCSLGTAFDLFGDEGGMRGIQVMTADPMAAGGPAEEIRAVLGPRAEVRTWMELNRQLFAALRVEKNLMFFLLIIITVVAAFGIANTLITVTVQKTREIGLLKALGFGSGAVMRVFFWQGWVAGLLGTGLGIVTGLWVLRHRNNLLRFLSARFGLELFPKEIYQLGEIPALTVPADIVRVAVAVMIICTLAGVVPAFRAARLDPARALRSE